MRSLYRVLRPLRTYRSTSRRRRRQQKVSAPEVVPEAPKPDAMTVLSLLAEQVEQSGVRTIEGDVVGDDSFFLNEPYGTAWGWDDLQWGYGAPVSALSFNENMTTLRVHPDSSVPSGVTADWDPAIEYYTLDNTMTVAAPSAMPHPGLQRMPGIHAGARVGHHLAGGLRGGTGGRGACGVYGGGIQTGAPDAGDSSDRVGDCGASRDEWSRRFCCGAGGAVTTGARAICRRWLHRSREGACWGRISPYRWPRILR